MYFSEVLIVIEGILVNRKKWVEIYLVNKYANDSEVNFAKMLEDS